MTTTSAAGWSASAEAIGGELVSTVHAWSCGSLRASSRLVVEPSRMITRAPASTATAAWASAGFASGPGLAPVAEGALLRRGRQRAAVDALDEALRGELAQVAADRVLGHPELLDEARRDDLAVACQRVEDRVAALGAEEGARCAVHACLCMILHGSRAFPAGAAERQRRLGGRWVRAAAVSPRRIPTRPRRSPRGNAAGSADFPLDHVSGARAEETPAEGVRAVRTHLPPSRP